MRKLINCLILAFSTSFLCAQSLAPEVIATAGESYSNSNITMDWTLGEVMTESYVGGTIVLTQGFHQPNLKVTAIDDFDSGLGVIKVYPNPTSNTIVIEKERTQELELSLWDISGRIILQKKVAKELDMSMLDLSSLPAGLYVLRFSNDKNRVQNIRIKKL